MQCLRRLHVACLLCASFALPVLSQPAQMYQGNPRHTGASLSAPVRSITGVRFMFETRGPVRSVPVISSGVLYVGSGDGNLYAIDAESGRERWRLATGGAVNSSPAVADGIVCFTSKDRSVYGVEASTGRVMWQFTCGPDLPYRNGFDYYTSSPTVDNGIVYVGGGDGNLYALDLHTGSKRWGQLLGARVRCSPAVAGTRVIAGTMDGHLYALDITHGTRLWQFATTGASLDIRDFGYDRSAIVSSPSIANGVVTFGCRDGFVYAVGLADGSLRWTFNHSISWAISTPGRVGDTVFTGTSDGRFYQALSADSGREIWRYSTRGGVWSSPAITGNALCFGDLSGLLYGLDTRTGKELWKFQTGAAVYTSPAVSRSVVYCGSDDGYLYALQGRPVDATVDVPRTVVYWEEQKGFRWFQNGVDVWVRDFFHSAGYDVVDASGLKKFMEDQVAQPATGVVVFAQNDVPSPLVEGPPHQTLLRRYLDAGGKVVWLGTCPLAYQRDSSGAILGIDFTQAGKILGIHYPGTSLDMLGWYGATVTPEGTRWGLRGWWVGFGAVDAKEVSTVLAKDEDGMAACWVRNYGGPEGTGLVQLWIPRNTHIDLTPVKAAVEFGLRR